MTNEIAQNFLANKIEFDEEQEMVVEDKDSKKKKKKQEIEKIADCRYQFDKD